MAIRRAGAAVLASLLLPAAGALAQRVETVRFAHGASAATIDGTIRGDESIDYTLGARAGQAMSVRFEPSHPACYFNLLPPGSSDEAIHIGSVGGNTFNGTLPATGDYTVRSYLMRSAARRGETCTYTLTIEIPPL
jgi:hypothetical protein